MPVPSAKNYIRDIGCPNPQLNGSRISSPSLKIPCHPRFYQINHQSSVDNYYWFKPCLIGSNQCTFSLNHPFLQKQNWCTPRQNTRSNETLLKPILQMFLLFFQPRKGHMNGRKELGMVPGAKSMHKLISLSGGIPGRSESKPPEPLEQWTQNQ